MKIRLFCVLWLIPMCLQMLCSCANKSTAYDDYKEKIEQLQERPLSLPLEDMVLVQKDSTMDDVSSERTCELRLVVYTDTADCASCVLKNIYKWNELLEKVEKYGNRFEICFIFYPLSEQMDEFYSSMSRLKLSSPVYLDTLGVFEKANPQMPSDIDMHVFLLDADNNVLLVGNPLWNEEIKNLYWKTIEEKLGGKKYKTVEPH